MHVSLDEHGETVLETVIQGDTVREVLNYVQFNSQDTSRRLPEGCGTGCARAADWL